MSKHWIAFWTKFATNGNFQILVVTLVGLVLLAGGVILYKL